MTTTNNAVTREVLGQLALGHLDGVLDFLAMPEQGDALDVLKLMYVCNDFRTAAARKLVRVAKTRVENETRMLAVMERGGGPFLSLC